MATGLMRKLVGVLGAMGLGLVALPAAAVFYNSNYDPPPFSGTALFEFDDACLATPGFHDAASCHLMMLSAHVTINNDGSGGTGLLDFAPVLPDSDDMINLDIFGGELVGVNTNPIGWVFASPCTGTGCGNVPWWFQFEASDSDPVHLFNGTCSSIETCERNPVAVATAFNVTFTRVPEPASLALVFAALAACGFARRRGRN